tara:strand:- start:1391 stop:1786 length:396 start_codon:yes stop_codon:yes gene_type:complete
VSDLPKVIHITKGPHTASVNWCGAPSDPNWPKDPDFKFALSLPICQDCIDAFDGDTLVLRKSTAAVTRTPAEAIEDGLITEDEIHDVVKSKPISTSSIMNLGGAFQSEAQAIIDEIYDDVNRQRSLKEWGS